MTSTLIIVVLTTFFIVGIVRFTRKKSQEGLPSDQKRKIPQIFWKKNESNCREAHSSEETQSEGKLKKNPTSNGGKSTATKKTSPQKKTAAKKAVPKKSDTKKITDKNPQSKATS